MASLSGNAKRKASLTCLFGAFVFLQFTVLGIANHAGEGYLATEQRDLVYYVLQAFVILGFLLNSLYFRLRVEGRIRKAAAYGFFGLLAACVAMMQATGLPPLANVIASMAAAFCVGGVGGAVHLRMSLETVAGDGIARCMGVGSAIAVILQYLLQIQWGATPFLPVFMLASAGILLFLLLRIVPISSLEGDRQVARTSPQRIAVVVVIASAFMLFACFYNETIHHLMIQSSYSTYTAYSWPRLMLVPGYLLFAAIGDANGGRYVPLATLCIMLVALLNVVLVGDAGTYWLNMCLFYFVIAALTSYYLLTFWRLAPGTRHPAFWAPFGRMLDSGAVLLTGAIHLSTFPVSAVIALDVAGIALVIVLMAVGGDFNLTRAPSEPEAPVPSPEERVKMLADECGLTGREREVLEALVLTDDKNQQIADSLFISRRQLQRHVSSIYEKTGATSRAGLIIRANGESPTR